MTEKVLVIVGAGLAGSILINRLAKKFNVVCIVDEGIKPIPSISCIDSNRELNGTIFTGFGGTTRLWHNALVKINTDLLAEDWITRIGLHNYYPAAEKLLGVPNSRQFNFDEMLVPKHRLNVWSLTEKSDFQVIKGRASHYVKDGDIVVGVYVEGQGVIEGDYFVDCSGGLGVVNTLLSDDNSDFGEAQSYEDHLCGYVGSIRLKNRFPYGKALSDGWTVRFPIVLHGQATWHVAFYLKPLLFMRSAPSKSLILTRLRNGPNRLAALLDFFANPQFVLEALFSRFGIGFDFKRYEVFAVLSHPDGKGSVIRDSNHLFVRTNHSSHLASELAQYFNQLVQSFGAECLQANFYQDCCEKLISGSHHSGTFPIGSSSGVDDYLKHRQCKNLFVCSGAVIPESSYANTGFTIATLALYLSDIFERQIR